MITVKSFIFNLFATNTYILSDETGECIIIDPASSKPSEEEELTEYIKKKSLIPKAQVITHYHVDHVVGIKFVKDTYGIGATAHKDGKIFWENTEKQGYEYGFNTLNILPPDHLVVENDIITFGNSELQVIEVPGHAAGSICLINHQQRFLIAGDVIFYGSIGRTDLPTGDFDLLRENILTKLFILNDNFVIYPGHGQKTHIGMERLHNPFIH
ncbi:MAG: MBL fold metallo-hydrolase [Omnitrophica WOR_2 bacterium]|jgi:glyoxylase-like metal-dependent hydrolase (beta-lactamase superfamily II)